jgi:hypothetical protein
MARGVGSIPITGSNVNRGLKPNGAAGACGTPFSEFDSRLSLQDDAPGPEVRGRYRGHPGGRRFSYAKVSRRLIGHTI